MSTADRTAGCIDPSANEQSVELFSSGAAEPQRRTATLCFCNHWQSVALHAWQTLETDSLSLTHRRQVDTCTRAGNSDESELSYTYRDRKWKRHFQHNRSLHLESSCQHPMTKIFILIFICTCTFQMNENTLDFVTGVTGETQERERWRGERTLMHWCI